ncbi:MAG: hypothetical protein HY672_00820 [Chloroflexi bacterium]|nr:hypothetical protein [Chloroflexota bacterium]
MQPTNTRDRGVELLEEVLRELLVPNPDLVTCFRKALLSARIQGWQDAEQWMEQELNGYTSESVPPWRQAQGKLEWIGDSRSDIIAHVVKDPREFQSMPTTMSLYQPVAELVRATERGFAFGTERRRETEGVGGRRMRLHQLLVVGGDSVAQVLERTGQHLFDVVSKAAVTLQFGNVAASIFSQYQTRVDSALASAGLENHLQTAYENLSRDNATSWQAAAFACRNMVEALADTLWQVQGDTYPYLPAGDGKGHMDVRRDKPRNRLRAYLHRKGISAKGDKLLGNGLQRLTSLIDDLYDEASAGHKGIKFEDAQSVVIQTYIWLGELVRLTDMKPVFQIQPTT